LSKIETAGVPAKIDKDSYTSVGALLSVGASYMLTENIGAGLNVQYVLFGKLTDDQNRERKPTGIGVTLGVSYRF
jgi:opacity protein-like surface antigen